MGEAVVTDVEAELHGLSSVALDIDDRIEIRLRIAAPARIAAQRIAEAARDRAVVRIGQETAGRHLGPRTATVGRHLEDRSIEATAARRLEVLLIPELEAQRR